MIIDPGTSCLLACSGSPSSLTLSLCSSWGSQHVPPCGWLISHHSPVLQLNAWKSVFSLMWLSVYCLLWFRNLSFMWTWLPIADGFPCCIWKPPTALSWCNQKNAHVVHADPEARRDHHTSLYTAVSELKIPGDVGMKQEIMWSSREVQWFIFMEYHTQRILGTTQAETSLLSPQIYPRPAPWAQWLYSEDFGL